MNGKARKAFVKEYWPGIDPKIANTLARDYLIPSDLSQFSDELLLRIPGIGRKSLTVIREYQANWEADHGSHAH